MISIEKQVLSRIYGRCRGWVFSRKDFSLLAPAEHIDKSLSRLATKGTIRRLARGLYDYPKFSHWLQETLGPDMDQVAHALARKFGWNIQVTGNAALNIMGISTQVPTRYIYLSDGPSRTYSINGGEISFKKTRFTHMGFKLHQSSLLVQAIETLGPKGVSSEYVEAMARYLSPQGKLAEKQRNAIAKDTQFVTSWVQAEITTVLNLASQLKDVA